MIRLITNTVKLSYNAIPYTTVFYTVRYGVSPKLLEQIAALNLFVFCLQSEQFQADIFPDTAGPLPAMSADEWVEGADKGPLLTSLKVSVTFILWFLFSFYY